MRIQGRRRWLWAAAAACCALAAGIFWLRRDRSLPLSERVARLPLSNRLVAYIDVRALRRAGIVARIAGAPVQEEEDYRRFVRETGFNYRTDLDSVVLAYSREETHCFLEGRFNWPRLKAYALSQGGRCPDAVCAVPSADAATRWISFVRLQANTMALAASADPDAVRKVLDSPAGPRPTDLPADPVWFLLPVHALREEALLPRGTRMFAGALAEADRVFVAIGPEGNAFRAALSARCRNEQHAAQAVRELEAATALLNRMIAREKKSPNPRDLSGVLAQGVFQAEGSLLRGRWPIPRELLESLGEAP